MYIHMCIYVIEYEQTLSTECSNVSIVGCSFGYLNSEALLNCRSNEILNTFWIAHFFATEYFLQPLHRLERENIYTIIYDFKTI